VNRRGDEFEAESCQAQLRDDFRRKRARRVRKRRAAEAGRNRFCYGGPAHHLTPLNHQGLQARAGEIEGRHETVHASADDDDVLRVRHCSDRQEFRSQKQELRRPMPGSFWCTRQAAG